MWRIENSNELCALVSRFQFISLLCIFKEWASFFWAHEGINRIAGNKSREPRSGSPTICLFRAPTPPPPHLDPEKKKTFIPYIYDASNKDPF